MICIYAIINILDDKYYIGQAADKDYRWSIHRKELKGFYHHSILLQRAWCKYGPENFIFVVLEVLDSKEKLNEREAHWGNLLKPEYNIAPLGGSMRGYKHTDEAKENMRKSHIGHKASDLTKAKMTWAQLGNQNAKGQKHTPERIEARAKLHRGKPKSDEHKRKIAEGNRGKVVTSETRERMRIAAINRYKNNPVSEETRRKLSEAAYRQWNG